MKTWKGRKIAEMWEESSSENHVQFGLIRFSQDRLNSKNKKSYLWAASKQKEYNCIQIDYSCYPALHFFLFLRIVFFKQSFATQITLKMFMALSITLEGFSDKDTIEL